MSTEIERKYLLKEGAIEKLATFHTASMMHAIEQGYLTTDPTCTVRVRSITVLGSGGYMQGTAAYLTIKGKSAGAVRAEFEYTIPQSDASELLDMCEMFVHKNRWFVTDEFNQLWHIDVFFGKHYGLILAEIELESEDQEVFLPEWIDREVTDDPQYYNSNLAQSK